MLLAGQQGATLLWWPWDRPDDRQLAEQLGTQIVVYGEAASERDNPRTLVERGGDDRQVLHEEIHGSIDISSDGTHMWIATERQPDH